MLAIAGLFLGPAMAFAQSAPITRFVRYVGNMNYVATGGSLRTQDNNGDACAVGATNTAALNGIPAGSSIVAAYLYWGGSGATVDSSVTLNASTVTASRTFTTTFNNGGTDFPFFELPNVLGSPHNSSIVAGTMLTAARLAAQNVVRYLNGEPVHGVVRRSDYVA